MNKHLKRFLLTSAWTGLAIVVIGAFGNINVLIFAGFGLIVGFIALVMWSKTHNPVWYNDLK